MSNTPRVELLLRRWGDDSRQAPDPVARDRARLAMHAALAETAHRVRLRPPALGGRLRWWAGLGLATAAAVVVGSLAVLGWNAPAGSPLFAVRATRQSVQLALPGANAASLHLQFAEQDLGDAERGLDPVASLLDARSELAAAAAVLPANHSSPLWARFTDDQAALEAEGGSYPQASPGSSSPSHPSAEPSDSGPEREAESPSATPTNPSPISSEPGGAAGEGGPGTGQISSGEGSEGPGGDG